MTSIQDLVMKEVNGICSRIAEQYPKNYYAWTHRIYVVSKLLLSTMFIKNNTNNNTDIIVRNINNISNFLETELKEKMYNEWLPKHPTDHSAIHYTCQILDHMFDILNQKEEYYVRVYLMEMYDIDDSYEQLHHQQQIKNIHAEVVKKKYELSSLALKQVQILLSKYCQSSNSDPNCNCNESLWILRRMTCQIIWKHSSSSSSYVVIKHHAMMMMMRQLVRNDIKSVIDSLNIIPTRISSSLSDKEEEEEEDSSLSLSLSQLVDAGSANGDANGDDEKIEAISYKNNIHSWTFLAWCIVNITNIDIDVDDNNDNSNSNDNEKTKTKRPPSSSSSFSLSSFSSTTTTTSTLFTHDLRETVMRRLQGAEATATTTTATAANYNGSTADATATAATTTTATSTTVQHNTRIWTSSSSPNILLV
ncbi:hypothetical protein FRACYDRAFT_265000 [Fragilariopsis cylindrus CCMP1102]|uniref:Protein prenylyltransferase n=1 Tax=Fragilariopsis cylindrus CCMP1102 TaxID=635003 RepID=A0A1E7EMY0_9STRA|nr:hypothetical protein FRACYDRAFT_265000 [Fragilariopsis cylindrus CCMP1102]|eukprot:OEU07197.1 hypothetical protein FRACYDRAFT_265000 [Fragilariopsis cylindrus CCMP1102]